MASLELTFTNLLSETGYYLGFGRDTTLYDAEQTARATAAVEAGLRTFYYPEQVDDLQFTGWSFLNKMGTITLASSDYDYDLASDFESIIGPMHYAVEKGRDPLRVVSEEDILTMRQQTSGTGTPEFVAIRPKTSTGTAVQGWEAIVWPTSSISETVYYRYIAQALKADGTALYPLGQPSHSETIKEACLAAAELLENDTEGPHYARFKRLLKASMDNDQRANTPEFLGRNTDDSWFELGAEYGVKY